MHNAGRRMAAERRDEGDGPDTDEPVDALIVTGMKSEYEAVLAVNRGALSIGGWEERRFAPNVEAALCSFRARDGMALRLAVTRVLWLGGVAPDDSLLPLVKRLRPRVVALCGVCAGRRGAVELGDVIIGSRLWCFDADRLVAERDERGRSVKRFSAEALPFEMIASLREAAEQRARDGGVTSPRVRIGPIGTGRQIVRDAPLWDRLPQAMREVLGVETEAAIASSVVQLGGVADLILAKGVTRFIDGGAQEVEPKAAGRCAELVVAFLQDAISPAAHRAALLLRAAEQKRTAGDGEAATRSALGAVDIFRALCISHPGQLRGELPRALGQLALAQLAAGLRAEALRSASESVALHRSLLDASDQTPEAATGPSSPDDREGSRWQAEDPLMPALATSIEVMARVHNELGQAGESLRATEESVAIRRRLAALRPAEFAAALAARLTHLSRLQRNAGMRTEAVESMQEAVTLYRGLAATAPDAFLADLAASLNNLGGLNAVLDRNDSALEAMREATDLYRALAESRPDAYLPSLAMSAFNLGSLLDDLGAIDEALEATLEARQVFEALAGARPEAYRASLAMTLLNLGRIQAAIGQPEDALTATGDAVAILRALDAVRAGRHVTELMMGLDNLVRMRRDLDDPAGALQEAEEVVALGRRLFLERPETGRAELALKLFQLGGIQRGLGRHQAAAGSTQEALDLHWPLFVARPEEHAATAGGLLRQLVELLEAVGRQPGNELMRRLDELQRLTGGR